MVYIMEAESRGCLPGFGGESNKEFMFNGIKFQSCKVIRVLGIYCTT